MNKEINRRIVFSMLSKCRCLFNKLNTDSIRKVYLVKAFLSIFLMKNILMNIVVFIIKKVGRKVLKE
ncbi:Uncharacterised protein [Orientia tsutsugamushi]|uniref:Uncharacterized protein n=1 Tax=Orientia tsutsugamushi TaxID=784 RepID=A0A2U3QSI4_ORITS|nr:hypothetical protein OTSUT76_3836 [Orientia tsutsugamushi str. UT76]KJV88520.1 hypothetical protein OTSUT76_1308 [Orientia tsutsugamushi str. UT76]SPR03935.1 Uncharacterised protein [Orientia tsutsugamushi]SPR04496.1 Uncharacterised protein [Orientia tsutsugamushi]